MKFRPCIDIHKGQVKQIVGMSLADNFAVQENFVSDKDASVFAGIFKRDGIYGGHIIMLDKSEETKRQALAALKTFPYGLQIGGGITPDNAQKFIDAGASHVIITSYIFEDGKLNIENLFRMVKAIGEDKLILDLSCRKQGDYYYMVTNKWQTLTNFEINEINLNLLDQYCNEFLIHGADVEGMQVGVEEELLKLLSEFNTKPITYAGGIKDMEDIEKIKEVGKGKIDFTVGSALDLFGGNIKYKELIKKYAN